ncbi:hypothetical protein H2248_008171 [Termitomyces sp. 'cryptogamus']|nr:hypothetical protein H2248_008171 [Termitomyces sp. 'cryptogamus']
MATIGIQASHQCDECHQRPKYTGSRFCSKGCASAAAPGPSTTGPVAANNLCIECGQRSKCQGFDYCSKGCASKATQAKQLFNGQNSTPSQNLASSKPQNPPLVASSKFCIVCQQRLRFQNHAYCGKTCAAKGGTVGQIVLANPSTIGASNNMTGSASNLCIQCLQKPKFSGHDFCSKSCGVTWKSNNP